MLLNNHPEDPDLLLKEEDAGLLLNLSVRTLQAWRIRLAGPPFVQVGRAVRYRRRDLIAWIDANTIGSGRR
jgi:helix-turn-helix protein